MSNRRRTAGASSRKQARGLAKRRLCVVPPPPTPAPPAREHPQQQALEDFVALFDRHLDALAEAMVRALGSNHAVCASTEVQAVLAATRRALSHVLVGAWTAPVRAAHEKGAELARSGVGCWLHLEMLTLRTLAALAVPAWRGDPQRLSAALAAGRNLSEWLMGALTEGYRLHRR